MILICLCLVADFWCLFCLGLCFYCGGVLDCGLVGFMVVSFDLGVCLVCWFMVLMR